MNMTKAGYYEAAGYRLRLHAQHNKLSWIVHAHFAVQLQPRQIYSQIKEEHEIENSAQILQNNANLQSLEIADSNPTKHRQHLTGHSRYMHAPNNMTLCSPTPLHTHQPKSLENTARHILTPPGAAVACPKTCSVPTQEKRCFQNVEHIHVW